MNYPFWKIGGRKFAVLEDAEQWAAIHVEGRVALMEKFDVYTPSYVLYWVDNSGK